MMLFFSWCFSFCADYRSIYSARSPQFCCIPYSWCYSSICWSPVRYGVVTKHPTQDTTKWSTHWLI